jgi:hypothetical protein
MIFECFFYVHFQETQNAALSKSSFVDYTKCLRDPVHTHIGSVKWITQETPSCGCHPNKRRPCLAVRMSSCRLKATPWFRDTRGDIRDTATHPSLCQTRKPYYLTSSDRLLYVYVGSVTAYRTYY